MKVHLLKREKLVWGEQISVRDNSPVQWQRRGIYYIKETSK